MLYRIVPFAENFLDFLAVLPLDVQRSSIEQTAQREDNVV